jgi:solute carrier family 6 amino acid transporter-like protein 5/7/9/14
LPGLGFANFYVSILVALYYNMIMAWTIYYLFASFTSELPWASCGQEFNSECENFDHKIISFFILLRGSIYGSFAALFIKFLIN